MSVVAQRRDHREGGPGTRFAHCARMSIHGSLLASSVFAALLAACGGSHRSTLSVHVASAEDGLTGQRPWLGHVVSTPPGIDCTLAKDGSQTGSCSMTIDDADGRAAHFVSLDAQGYDQSTFDGWVNASNGTDFEGPLEVSNASLELVVATDHDYAYIATFGPKPTR
jgi:hypothetical protein